MELIDKATIVAEIDRRIEENKADIQRAIHKHLEEYFEGYEDALVLFKEKFIDTLEVKEINEMIKNAEDHAYFAGSENTRKKLIDNNIFFSTDVDEAIDKYTDNPANYLEYSDDGWEDKTDIDYVERAFKAGAEWMAGQGETLYDYINVDGKNQRWLGENLLQGDYDAGQAVIVQIRKV